MFAAGTMHDLGGKKVEVKPATPKGSGSLARTGSGATAGSGRPGGGGMGAGGTGSGRSMPPFGAGGAGHALFGSPPSPYGGYGMYGFPPGGELCTKVLGWVLAEVAFCCVKPAQLGCPAGECPSQGWQGLAHLVRACTHPCCCRVAPGSLRLLQA